MWLGHHFQGQKVKGQGHQAALLTAVLTRQAAAAVSMGTYWPWETAATLPSARRREALRRPQRMERDGGISWRPPAYSWLKIGLISVCVCVCVHVRRLVAKRFALVKQAAACSGAATLCPAAVQRSIAVSCQRLTFSQSILSHGQLGNRSTLADTDALTPRRVKRPGDLYLWPFDLESGVRVTCDVGYLCASFSLPRPLCSPLGPDVRDRRQTGVRRQTASSLNDDASASWSGGLEAEA